MTPLRPSLHLIFLVLLGVFCCFFLLLDFHQSEIWARSYAAIQLGGKKLKEYGNSANFSQLKTLFMLKPLDDPRSRPWYMAGGQKRPVATSKSGRKLMQLWPEENLLGSDRVEEQLMFVPPADASETAKPLKKIFIFKKFHAWGWKMGRQSFVLNQCPVDTCELVDSMADPSQADAVFFLNAFPANATPWHRSPNQVWILFFSECPYCTPPIKQAHGFNWTATYRWDSDVVAPYERWAYYDQNVKSKPRDSPAINYAANKTKQVAWFVSNCFGRNGRLNYARELSKHISVDVYGKCGNKKCPRSSKSTCMELLAKEYKFYLAFENSNCKDYITEKFFENALSHNVIPIAMGAPPEDYERSAPLNSYLHVDNFTSPRELADYLHKLDKDDDLYNEYFRWKGTGELINTSLFCRICAMLHDPQMPRKTYKDVAKWWHGPETCVDSSWREHRANRTTALAHKSP